jgi:type IX secretion system PorP/SprF family membrane protein
MHKKLMRKHWWFISLVFAVFELRGQDPHFTQYYANPLYLNPAFAGSDICPRFSMNYRNQFPNFGAYQTYSASYDQYVDAVKGGLGLLILRDDAGNGTLSTTEISGIYSYHLKVSRKFTVLAGFQGTLRSRSLNWGDFTFPDQIDPFYGFVLPSSEVPPGSTTNTHFDLSFGAMGYTKNFYLGLALHHITQPNEAFFSTSALPTKFTAHVGANIPLGKRRLHNEVLNYLIPNITFQTQGPSGDSFAAGSFMQVNYSLAFMRNGIAGGLGFRQNSVNVDALLINFGFMPEGQAWRIGYSYDYTISEFSNAGGGAHEIALAYQFPCRVKKKRLRAIKCPKF